MCAQLGVLEVAGGGPDPAMAGTLLPEVALMTGLTRLELDIGPPLMVRNCRRA